MLRGGLIRATPQLRARLALPNQFLQRKLKRCKGLAIWIPALALHTDEGCSWDSSALCQGVLAHAARDDGGLDADSDFVDLAHLAVIKRSPVRVKSCAACCVFSTGNDQP